MSRTVVQPGPQVAELRSEVSVDALYDKLVRRDDVSAQEKAVLRDVLGPSTLVAAGNDLVREGGWPDVSTVLVSGFAARYTTLADGGRQITELNVAGDFVDLHSFLIREMDHGVVALTNCVIRTVPHRALRHLTEAFPHLTRLLWLDTLVDAAIHRQWIASMGRRTALAHLAHLLCETYLRLEVVGLAAERAFDFPLPQSVLADVLGLSTVHVNRLVAELRSLEVVNWTQPRVVILDWDRLAGIAEFDPTYLRLTRQPV